MQATFSINNTDKAEVAIVKMNQLRDVQTENLVNLMKRDEKLDNLHDKLTEMDTESSRMSKTATKVRRNEQWKGIYLKLIMVLVVLVMLYLIFAIGGCGFDLNKCI